MYILKTKGTNKIPDFIQIRDKDFALIAHIRANNIKSGLSALDIPETENTLVQQIKALPYGIIKKINN